MKKKKILILAAHPDDETLGCGGTIAKLSQLGHDVELITFTNGEGARDNVDNLNRNDQLEKVSEILGINKFSFGNFPDNKMDTIPLLEICKFLETKIISSPNIIFTHHPDCLNIDHSIVYRSTVTVFRPQTKNEIEINSFHIPSSTEWNPLGNFKANVYFDVEGYVEKKIQALKCYDKEMRKYPHPRSYESVMNNLRTNGNEVGLNYCEKFQLIRKVLL